MSIFDVLDLVCGLALFLFGINFMGETLKRSAGNRLKSFLENITASPVKGFFFGAAVTAAIQSSSAATVMVVGFVNSGAMTLSQAISVIMGANVGTTVTSWLTGLSGLGSMGEEAASFLKWLKPSSFVPIVALIGILFYMLGKSSARKNVGSILLGFSILMVGMELMSAAVSPLAENEGFKATLLWFENPILGVLAGALMTAILQSSSAAVGILQSLTVTGAINFENAIPILLGQNIGTCITAILASVGAGKNAKRAAFVHLYFNVIGVSVFLSGFYLINNVVNLPFVGGNIDMWGIAIIHTVFNLLSVLLIAPFSHQLEKLVRITVKDGSNDIDILDKRLISTPSVAIERTGRAAIDMAHTAKEVLKISSLLLYDFDAKRKEEIYALENKVDTYEDMIGNYIVSISPEATSPEQNIEMTKLLHIIGDLERISDHAVNIGESAAEIKEKKIIFSDSTLSEMRTLSEAVGDIMEKSVSALENDNTEKAYQVEALERIVDELRDKIKFRHIERVIQNESAIEYGFVLSDVLTNYERIADHCVNIAEYILQISESGTLNVHGYGRENDGRAEEYFKSYSKKYMLNDK